MSKKAQRHRILFTRYSQVKPVPLFSSYPEQTTQKMIKGAKLIAWGRLYTFRKYLADSLTKQLLKDMNP